MTATTLVDDDRQNTIVIPPGYVLKKPFLERRSTKVFAWLLTIALSVVITIAVLIGVGYLTRPRLSLLER